MDIMMRLVVHRDVICLSIRLQLKWLHLYIQVMTRAHCISPCLYPCSPFGSETKLKCLVAFVHRSYVPSALHIPIYVSLSLLRFSPPSQRAEQRKELERQKEKQKKKEKEKEKGRRRAPEAGAVDASPDDVGEAAPEQPETALAQKGKYALSDYIKSLL